MFNCLCVVGVLFGVVSDALFGFLFVFLGGLDFDLIVSFLFLLVCCLGVWVFVLVFFIFWVVF